MKNTSNILLTNARCVLEESIEPKNLFIKNGKFFKILGPSQQSIDGETIDQIVDLENQLVFPGGIDTQVHFREPGLTHKEDLEHGSKGALLGGITSFFEMPNTKPSTTNANSIAQKVEIASNKSYTNFAFYMGGTRDNLKDLIHSHEVPGCCGIKIFLGSSTGDLLLFDQEILKKIFSQSKNNIAVHSENEEMLRKNIAIRDQATSVHAHYAWRDVETALSSTQMVLRLAKETGKKIHILHISTKEEIQLLMQHKNDVTFEVTPQHATMYAPDCYDQLDTFAQMNPPIRTKDHRDVILKSLAEDGPVVIGSDHAPHLKEEKLKGYPESPAGLPGVQTIFPIILDHALNGKLTLLQLKKYLCSNPADRFGIQNKGHIREGYDADLLVVNEQESFTIRDEDIQSKCGWSPFNGKELKGNIKKVMINGEFVVENHKIIKKPNVQALSFTL